MEFIFAKETGTNIPHCTFKHGVSVETVKTAFPLVMRDFQDGNHRVRFCKCNRAILRVAYDWVKMNQKVKIFSAYYI